MRGAHSGLSAIQKRLSVAALLFELRFLSAKRTFLNFEVLPGVHRDLVQPLFERREVVRDDSLRAVIRCIHVKIELHVPDVIGSLARGVNGRLRGGERVPGVSLELRLRRDSCYECEHGERAGEQKGANGE